MGWGTEIAVQGGEVITIAQRLGGEAETTSEEDGKEEGQCSDKEVQCRARYQASKEEHHFTTQHEPGVGRSHECFPRIAEGARRSSR